MAISKLGIYNNALHLLGERRLSNIYEDREPRHVLDQNYGLSLVEYCLEVAQPRFAVKTAKLATPSTSSVHGIDEVYSFPADFVSVLRDPGSHSKIGCFFADEDLEDPVSRYIIEGNTVACEVATNLYMRYITNSIQPNGWSPLFGRLVSAYLARECASRINPSRIDMLTQHFEKTLAEVIQTEAVKENDFVIQKAAASLSADQLNIYNQVAAALGKPEFRYIDDESVVRLAIDSIYDIAERVNLDTVRPKFATEVAALTGGSTSAVHAVDNVFNLPADFITILSLWANDELEDPIQRYFIEGSTIVVDSYSTAYMRYVKKDVAEANWPPAFAAAVAAYVAKELAPRFAPERQELLESQYEKRLALAVASEANKELQWTQVATSLSATQLQVYNIAAAAVSQPELRYTEDESELRHALDSLYEPSVNFLLEAIRPRFATRVVSLTSGAPSAVHGYDNVFTLPADFKQFVGLWSDEALDEPIYRYFIEDDDIAIAHHSTAYLRYVSTATAESEWMPGFIKALGFYLAAQVAPRFKPEEASRANKRYEDALQASMIADGTKEQPRPLASARTLTTVYRTLYNTALDLVDLPPIISNDDESERKVAIDYALNQGAEETVMELISWGWPRKSVKLEKDDVLSPEFGYQNAFALPSDLLRINEVSADEYFRYPVEYRREGDTYFCDADPIYLSYVSNENVSTPSAWPRYYYNLVAAEIATRLGGLPGANISKALAKYKEYKKEAYNTDAQRNPPQLIVSGSWNRARDTWQRRRHERP